MKVKAKHVVFALTFALILLIAAVYIARVWEKSGALDRMIAILVAATVVSYAFVLLKTEILDE